MKGQKMLSPTLLRTGNSHFFSPSASLLHWEHTLKKWLELGTRSEDFLDGEDSSGGLQRTHTGGLGLGLEDSRGLGLELGGLSGRGGRLRAGGHRESRRTPRGLSGRPEDSRGLKKSPRGLSEDSIMVPSPDHFFFDQVPKTTSMDRARRALSNEP